MTGRLENMIIGADGIKHISFVTADSFTEYDDLKDRDCDITIKKHYDKRSTTANAYMWELCTKLAEKISDDGTITTKEDIYRETVRNVGVFRDIPMISGYEDTLRTAWERHGTAWLTETVDYDAEHNATIVRCYYGSSTYNKKQMNRLIQALQQDCEAVGVDHRTPEEVANMISLWESAERG